MNDIDFMIAPRDREAVMNVMQELGFRPFFEWAKDSRREEISSRLNPDHLPKLAREIDQPGTRIINVDVANSLTWTKSPFVVPVEEALEKHGDEELLASQMQSSAYVSASGQPMRERLQSKARGSLRPVAPTHSGS